MIEIEKVMSNFGEIWKKLFFAKLRAPNTWSLCTDPVYNGRYSSERNRGLRGCDVFGFVNPYTSPSVIVQIKKSIHFQQTEKPSFLTSCRVFNFQRRHKCQNFLLSLNRDQGLRGCDVFGFVNPYTFCELKNPRFSPVAAFWTRGKRTSVKTFDAWCPNSFKCLMRDSSL